MSSLACLYFMKLATQMLCMTSELHKSKHTKCVKILAQQCLLTLVYVHPHVCALLNSGILTDLTHRMTIIVEQERANQ